MNEVPTVKNVDKRISRYGHCWRHMICVA
jgi:hypothetical protein